MMSNVAHIVQQLESASGRLEKMAILEQHRDNEELKQFFYLSLDPLITFGIKKIPTYSPGSHVVSLSKSMEALTALIKREKTGLAAADHLASVLASSVSPNLIQRIIEKDPGCGVAEGTVNKVWKGLIFSFPVMKASPYDEDTIKNITFPAVSQTKLDGARLAIVIEKGRVTCLSSSGREITTHGVFDWLSSLVDNVVLDGELLVTDSAGKFLDRKTGNGIINRAIHGTIPVNLAQNLHFVMFDIIPLKDWMAGKCDTEYSERLRKMAVMSENFRYNVTLVESKIVKSEREALGHFTQLLKDGQEGTILKNLNSPWEGKRRKDHLKMKGIITTDLLIVGTEEGTGKNQGKIGALICESADGLVRVNVGTGLTDDDRSRAPKSYIGKIAEIAYNERIQNKDETSIWSLFLPRFYRIRIDKTEPDSITNIPLKA